MPRRYIPVTTTISFTWKAALWSVRLNGVNTRTCLPFSDFAAMASLLKWLPRDVDVPAPADVLAHEATVLVEGGEPADPAVAAAIQPRSACAYEMRTPIARGRFGGRREARHGAARTRAIRARRASSSPDLRAFQGTVSLLKTHAYRLVSLALGFDTVARLGSAATKAENPDQQERADNTHQKLCIGIRFHHRTRSFPV